MKSPVSVPVEETGLRVATLRMWPANKREQSRAEEIANSVSHGIVRQREILL